jgi:c-di-GMP-related signal transduction protein
MSIVYVCLVVRSYFLAQAETDLAFANMMLSRANLCEVLAMKLLSRFATNYIQLVAVLTTTWNPLSGANQDVIQEVKQSLNAHNDDDMGSMYDQSAIEVR